MNIFKKIGAAVFAAALMTATTLTASAASDKGFSLSVEQSSDGIIITANEVSAKYAECEAICADIIFTTLKIVDGAYEIDHNNRYMVRARQEYGYSYGAWIVWDTKVGEWQSANEGGSGLAVYIYNESTGDGKFIIGLEGANQYYESIFADCNAISVSVYGIKDGQQVSYSSDGELSQVVYNTIMIIGDVKEETTTSEPIGEPTSKPTSEPTSESTSEPISETTSEPTSESASEPASEPTSSEPASSEPASSEPAGNGDNDNPNSGAAMALIPLVIVGGAAAVVSKKRSK